MSRWQDQAACSGLPLTLFFPWPADEQTRQEAISVCRECPVAEQCRAFAIERATSDGVWGGEDFSVKRVRKVPAEAVTG